MSQDFALISATLFAVGRGAALSLAREALQRLWRRPLAVMHARRCTSVRVTTET